MKFILTKTILLGVLLATFTSSYAGRVDAINEAYTTVVKGDRSALTYIPGKGTTLWTNDQADTNIEGVDFAQLYFRIWLGEQPISESMRKALIGTS